MPEIKKKVHTYVVEYKCDKPGCNGVMRPTGVALPSNPMKYVHVCTKCPESAHFTEMYPVMRTEEIKEDL